MVRFRIRYAHVDSVTITLLPILFFFRLGFLSEILFPFFLSICLTFVFLSWSFYKGCFDEYSVAVVHSGNLDADKENKKIRANLEPRRNRSVGRRSVSQTHPLSDLRSKGIDIYYGILAIALSKSIPNVSPGPDLPWRIRPLLPRSGLPSKKKHWSTSYNLLICGRKFYPSAS